MLRCPAKARRSGVTSFLGLRTDHLLPKPYLPLDDFNTVYEDARIHCQRPSPSAARSLCSASYAIASRPHPLLQRPVHLPSVQVANHSIPVRHLQCSVHLVAQLPHTRLPLSTALAK